MPGEVEFGAIVIALLGGLAIFLHGMDRMTRSLKLVAGDRMKSLLARMTTNRIKAVFTGAFITAIIQSSSVTTVLVVGFISAGLLSLSQSIGIIMGASIGTTVTAQVVAFKVTKYALLLVAAGFAMEFLSKNRLRQQYGRMLMGLGLIFFGMQVMKEATSPLRDYEPFVEMLKNLDSPALAVLFSALFTGLVQSSSATTGVIIVLASQGFLTLESGIALVLGANIGTCVTACLAAIGKPREAVRAAVVHILFNTSGVLIWIGLIPYLAEFIQFISPVAEGLEGLDRVRAETPRQIANAHTVFNVANTLIFIGFTPLIARLVERLVPDRKLGSKDGGPRREYLDDILVHTPSLALDLARAELARLGASVLKMVKEVPGPVLSGTAEQLDELREMDDGVDTLHGALITYLGRLSLEPLTEGQAHRLSEYIAAANYFESMGDMVENNLVDAGRLRVMEGLEISEETRGVLRELHAKVVWSVERTTEALASDDVSMAEEIAAAKAEMNEIVARASEHLSRRLAADRPNRLAVYRLESEVVEALQRIYYFSKRIAKLVIEETPLYDRSSGGLAAIEIAPKTSGDERSPTGP